MVGRSSVTVVSSRLLVLFRVARLAAESGQQQALVLTLAYTGIRWGEAVALRMRDVQFLRRRLTVADNAVQWARSELEIWPSPAARGENNGGGGGI